MKAEVGLILDSVDRLSQMNGELERTFLQMHSDSTALNRMSYETLPATISSGGIDLYATLLARQTNSDPHHRERLGHIADTSIGSLVYRDLPIVGDEQGVSDQPFKPEVSGFLKIEVHTHPDMSLFGGKDLFRMAYGPGKFYVLGAGNFNYYVLPTEESPWLDPSFVHRSNRYSSTLPLVPGMRTLDEAAVDKGVPYTQDALRAISVFKDQHDYAQRFSALLGMADRFSWGVYYSSQNGLLKQLTQESSIEIAEQNYEYALRNSGKSTATAAV